MFALKVIDGLSAGVEIALKQNGVISVGRAADADGQIEDGQCSGKHFEVVWSETDGIQVKDLGSLNGIFLNGERVREPRRLKRGDFIQAGTTLIEVVVASQQVGAEVRVSDRAPALKGSATMMMSAADMQDAIANSRAQARVKQKDMGRAVVKTQMLTKDEIGKLMAEQPSGGHQKTMILQAIPAELIAQASQSGLAMLQQLLSTTPADSPAVAVVKKGASITPHAKSTLTLGRDARNDIPLVSDDVSGSHVRIVREPSGRFEMIDEGSTNGTFVNGKRVVRHYLNSGDLVQIGQWTATIAIMGPRIAIELQREGIKIDAGGGNIKVIKANDVGAKEWDPLHRNSVKSIKVDYKRDRAQMLATKKKGKSAADIAWNATSDTQRRALKGRLAWAGVITAPLMLVLMLFVTRLDALAPGAVGAHHASPEFIAKANTLDSKGAAVSCLNCHQGGQVSDQTCSTCHSEVAPTETHTFAGVTCFDCHAEHNGREFSPTAAAKIGCVGCHEGDPHDKLLTGTALSEKSQKAKHRAPVISQQKLQIDAFDVHKVHMSVEGRCLGCHAEGLKAIAADARKTCGTCHAQANPEPGQCITCHAQHPKSDVALAYLSEPTKPEERIKAARTNAGTLPIFLGLAVLMFVPITVIGFIKPKEKSEEEEVVEEKTGAAKPAAPAAALPAAAAPAAARPPPPPPIVAPAPPPPPPPSLPPAQAQQPAPQVQAPPPPPPQYQQPAPQFQPPPPPQYQQPAPPQAHGPTKTLMGTGAVDLVQAQGLTGPPWAKPANRAEYRPQMGPAGVPIPPPPER